MELDLIDLVELDLPAQLPGEHGPDVRRYIERIDRADAYIVVTPEYNHGYPASLKQAIDVPRGEWKAKPLGLVSYGGVGGGLRAVEQLRQVFAELHVVTVRNTVSFHQFWELFDAGQLRDPRGPDLAASVMLDELAWWAKVLRAARLASPPPF